MPLPAPGSLKLFMDALVALETVVATQSENDGFTRPAIYRWRPTGQVELPAIYNWLDTSPSEWRDATGHRLRDTLNLTARCAVRRTDTMEHMALLEGISDAFRQIVDAEFRSPQPLSNTAKWAERPSMRLVGDTFNEIEVLAVEFALQAQLDRSVTPT